jgi:hypothetical protein
MTATELLLRHPFPEAWAGAKRIERLWIHDVAGTPEALWPHISDTSRMNRALGTSEMQFTELDGQALRHVEERRREHEWVEPPWSWVANQWLTCAAHLLDRGFFMRVMFAVQRLERIATGTRIYIYFGAVPRSARSPSWPSARFRCRSSKRLQARVMPALADALERLRPDVLMTVATGARRDRRGADARAA